MNDFEKSMFDAVSLMADVNVSEEVVIAFDRLAAAKQDLALISGDFSDAAEAVRYTTLADIVELFYYEFM